MGLRLLTFDGCPNAAAARAVLRAVASTYPGLTIEEVTVEDPDHAERLGFRGSPSFVLDGSDLFADAELPVAYACRNYNTPDGRTGCPTAEHVVSAIARVRND